MYDNLSPAYSYCHQSPCYSECDERVYRKRRSEITGKQRLAANERERKRMNSINRGFEHLRQRLPKPQHEKKLSKVDTLKGAMEYIKQLQAALEHDLPTDSRAGRKILVNNASGGSSLCMVSWRRSHEKFGETHQSTRGPVVYQKDVWVPASQ